jgi:hypothetical protein
MIDRDYISLLTASVCGQATVVVVVAGPSKPCPTQARTVAQRPYFLHPYVYILPVVGWWRQHSTGSHSTIGNSRIMLGMKYERKKSKFLQTTLLFA